jgi:hypothetical protein
MRRPELIFQHSASADGFDVGIGARKHERGAGVALWVSTVRSRPLTADQ